MFARCLLVCLAAAPLRAVDGADCPLMADATVIEHNVTGNVVKGKVQFVGVKPTVTFVKVKGITEPMVRVKKYSSVPTFTPVSGGFTVKVPCGNETVTTEASVSAAVRPPGGGPLLFAIAAVAAMTSLWQATAAPTRRGGSNRAVAGTSGGGGGRAAASSPFLAAFLWLSAAASGRGALAAAAEQCDAQMEVEIAMPQCNICAVGCAPYGISKWGDWEHTVATMGQQCDLMIHLGDVIGGSGALICNRSILEVPILKMMSAGPPLLFTPSDNEVSDCHRAASDRDEGTPAPADFYKAEDARTWWKDTFFQDTTKDLTGKLAVQTQSADCPFNVYVEKCNVAVVTLEVPGSQFYLADESHRYFKQDEVDPIAQRKDMFTRANNCALSWVSDSVNKAKAAGLKTVFLCFHAAFWESTTVYNGNFGKAYSTFRLRGNVHNETTIGHLPYQPFGDKIIDAAQNNPDIMIYCLISDNHFFFMQSPDKIKNLVVVMTEGDSRGIETFLRLTIDQADHFDPVTVKEVHVEIPN